MFSVVVTWPIDCGPVVRQIVAETAWHSKLQKEGAGKGWDPNIPFLDLQ